MAAHKVKTYLNILGNTPEHHDLFFKINQLNEMQQVFLSIIPDNLVERCTVGRLSNEKLIIFVENGSIAAKLKQISPSLLLKLQKLGWEITAIQVTVQAYYYFSNKDDLQRKKKKVSKKLQLSQTGIVHLNQLVKKLPDSGLKDAVELLLKNSAKKIK